MTMLIHDLDEQQALDVIEKLRSGVPPRKYASMYSAGLDRFVANVRKRHLPGTPSAGKIRFVSGSWGSGKTHFFRLLTEQAFDANYLVSTVELSRHEAPFNKFELVLAAILRNIASSGTETDNPSATPLGDLFREAVEREQVEAGVETPEAVDLLTDRLMADSGIDIDMKKVIKEYWKTFTATDVEAAVLEERRGFLLQWFTGEVNKTQIHKEFNIQKTLSKENARLFLGSFVSLAQLLGYSGLLVLFDESEMTHSTMHKGDLKQSHNNLLHLINEVSTTAGLILVFAAVPAFFNDPKTGIGIYGALAGRIGRPDERPPAALDKVWNLDAAEITTEHYAEAGRRIRDIYLVAYPDDDLLTESQVVELVTHVADSHSTYERVSRWRAVITTCVGELDRSLEGLPPRAPSDSYADAQSTLDRWGEDA
jgi:hypothetical protein